MNVLIGGRIYDLVYGCEDDEAGFLVGGLIYGCEDGLVV
jgi:hypothetical protein